MLAAILTPILFAGSAVSGYRAAKVLGGTAANFWRLCVAAMLLAFWAHLWGLGWRGAAFPLFLLSGAAGFGLGDFALYQALPRLGSRLSMILVNCLAAPIAAAIEWLWLGTTLTAPQMYCGGVILLGVAIALAPSGSLECRPRDFVPGLLYGVLAAFGQGFGAVLSRKANHVAELAAESVDGISAAYQRILAGVAISAVVWVVAQQRWRWGRVGRRPGADPEASLNSREKWRQAAPWVLVNALAGPTLGVSCFQWALKTTATGIVLPIVATTPSLVIPFAYWLEGERPSVRSLVGGVIAVMGAAALTLL